MRAAAAAVAAFTIVAQTTADDGTKIKSKPCRLAEKQPGLLEELQSCAKSWSNSGLLRVVFVLSDGPALSQMKRAPSCT